MSRAATVRDTGECENNGESASYYMILSFMIYRLVNYCYNT